MLIPYYTVKCAGEIRFEISRSVFIGHAAQVESEEAAMAFINQVKKANRDANHNCSAYITGKQAESQKADDDGEPSGTAGKPILEVLKKQGLTNTAIVITRYFGGVKLGAGGLIRAYGKAASEAVRAAGIIERRPFLRVAVTVEYALLSMFESQLRNQGYIVTDKEFLAKPTLYVLRRQEDEEFLQAVADWSSGSAVVRDAGETYVDTDVLAAVVPT